LQDDEFLSDPSLKDTDEYRELVRLQQLRDAKLEGAIAMGEDSHSKKCDSISSSMRWPDPINSQTNYIDKDYVSSGVYSYLDPNYQPTES
jgi:hypothetical protein